MHKTIALLSRTPSWLVFTLLAALTLWVAAYAQRTYTIARALEHCELTVATPRTAPFLTAQQMDRLLADRVFSPKEFKFLQIQLNDGTWVTLVRTNDNHLAQQ